MQCSVVAYYLIGFLSSDHQTHDLVIDEDFFLCQLQKVISLFDLGEETFAATMTRKAVTMLQALIKQSELHSRSSGFTSRDRRKKGPGATVQVNQHSYHMEDGDESMKRKKQVRFQVCVAPEKHI